MAHPPAGPARRLVFLCSLVAATGCQAVIPAAFTVDPNDPPGHRWLICPGGNPAGMVRAVIGPGGGVLTHPSGHVLTVPAGAVAGDRTFTLHEPASQQMVVIATAQPATPFNVPISLTINYDRCTVAVDPARLQIFRVNQGGGHDPLGGVPVPPRSIRTDRLDRLSAYALATN